jgi:ABC-2 type transport system ATP-binding protein
VLSTHLIDEVSDLIEHVVLLDKGRVLIDEDSDVLRSQAVTVTGPTAAVEAFVAGRTLLHREQLGGFLRVTVSGEVDRPSIGGLEFEPVTLQQLVVRTTQAAAPVGAGNGGAR